MTKNRIPMTTKDRSMNLNSSFHDTSTLINEILSPRAITETAHTNKDWWRGMRKWLSHYRITEAHCNEIRCYNPNLAPQWIHIGRTDLGRQYWLWAKDNFDTELNLSDAPDLYGVIDLSPEKKKTKLSVEIGPTSSLITFLNMIIGLESGDLLVYVLSDETQIILERK